MTQVRPNARKYNFDKMKVGSCKYFKNEGNAYGNVNRAIKYAKSLDPKLNLSIKDMYDGTVMVTRNRNIKPRKKRI